MYTFMYTVYCNIEFYRINKDYRVYIYLLSAEHHVIKTPNEISSVRCKHIYIFFFFGQWLVNNQSQLSHLLAKTY